MESREHAEGCSQNKRRAKTRTGCITLVLSHETSENFRFKEKPDGKPLQSNSDGSYRACAGLPCGAVHRAGVGSELPSNMGLRTRLQLLCSGWPATEYLHLQRTWRLHLYAILWSDQRHRSAVLRLLGKRAKRSCWVWCHHVRLGCSDWRGHHVHGCNGG